MALVGISNDNGLYSEHYLAEIFFDAISNVVEVWQVRETKAREAAKANGECRIDTFKEHHDAAI